MNTTFDDFEDDGPDDNDAIARYAAQLRLAVDELGVPVYEPGEHE